jgi:hypothetical protein
MAKNRIRADIDREAVEQELEIYCMRRDIDIARNSIKTMYGDKVCGRQAGLYASSHNKRSAR